MMIRLVYFWVIETHSVITPSLSLEFIVILKDFLTYSFIIISQSNTGPLCCCCEQFRLHPNFVTCILSPEDNCIISYGTVVVAVLKVLLDRHTCLIGTTREISKCEQSQVREFEFDAEQQKAKEKNVDKLKTEVESKRGQLEEWSSTAYGEVSPHFCQGSDFPHTVHPFLITQFIYLCS